MHRINAAYYYTCRAFRGLGVRVWVLDTLCKNGGSDRDSRFGRQTPVCPRNQVLMEVMWRIRLNDPCTAATQPYVK